MTDSHNLREVWMEAAAAGQLYGIRETGPKLRLRRSQASIGREDGLEQGLGLGVPSSHRLARQGAVSVADIATKSFMMGRWKTWRIYSRIVRDLCRRQGFRPRLT